MHNLRILILLAVSTVQIVSADEIKIGWIGAMSGPVAKYAAWEAAQVAHREINASGGIAGKQVKLIAEDGKCNALAAVSAAKKLINVDRVKFIIGGHCSPESVAISPFTESAKVVQIAAISSSPKLSGASDYLFRMTGDIRAIIPALATYLSSLKKELRIAILYEETDYAVPEALALLDTMDTDKSLHVAFKDSFLPGTHDFRTLLVKANAKKLDYLFIGVQAADTAELIVTQARELGVEARLLGNTVVAGVARARGDDLFNGLIAIDSTTSPTNNKSVRLLRSFKKQFNFDELPLGVLTAEAYDALYLLKYAIEECGESKKQVRRCLENLKGFQGASGTLSFDEQHNGIRDYGVGSYQDGKWVKLQLLK